MKTSNVAADVSRRKGRARAPSAPQNRKSIAGVCLDGAQGTARPTSVRILAGVRQNILALVLFTLFTAISLASAQTNNPPLQIPDWVAAETNIAYDKYDATK